MFIAIALGSTVGTYLVLCVLRRLFLNETRSFDWQMFCLVVLTGLAIGLCFQVAVKTHLKNNSVEVQR